MALNERTPKPAGRSTVSLFAGCGGLDLGFREHGFDLLYAADNDPEAVEAFRHNIGDHIKLRDVRDADFRADIRAIGRADVVLGGFPCQGFSKAGPKRSDDVRNTLYQEMHWAISTLHPKVFIAENVDGLSQNFGGALLRVIVDDFSSLGYRVEYRIIDAVAFGVPQHRRRIIFVGVRSDQPDFSWPEATHRLPRRNGEAEIKTQGSDLFSFRPATQLSEPVSIEQAISNLPVIGAVDDHVVTSDWPKKYNYIMRAIKPGQKLCNVRHAATSVYSWQIPDAFGHASDAQIKILEVIGANRRHKKYGNIPNGNPLSKSDIEHLLGSSVSESDLNELLELGYLKIILGKFDLKGAMFCSGLFKRPVQTAPSPTVLTNFHNPRYFIHPFEDRPFSIRECARLQGFPDSFQFVAAGVSLVGAYRLIGNAVPPPVGRALALATKDYLDQEVGALRAA